MSKSSVNLPKTSFSMRANLPLKEPNIIDYWNRISLYEKLRANSKGNEKFVLHDGPPYANGNIHMGTALNKILKDIVTKIHQMNGKDSVYVPGWDCHGLPIEWKIEEQYKKKKKNKDEVPIKDFRQECREFAKSWIDVHIKEFKRLGVVGDFENYYSTMSYEAEAQIVRELGKFLLDGSLYQGFKPVLWSTVEKTALADAEVEYKDKVSNTIYAKFKINVHIKLTKNIPIASGMGGGSSNAATVIHCLKDLFKISIEKNTLDSLLFSLGADVPFCFFRKTAIVKGKGENIEFLSSKIPELPVLLINPLIEISTKKIFEGVRLSSQNRVDNDIDFFNSDLFFEGLNNRNNDLECVAERICPTIKEITSLLKTETNSKLVRMTGSGATCFGIFNNLSDLNKADILINSVFKEIWTKKTKIINKI